MYNMNRTLRPFDIKSIQIENLDVLDIIIYWAMISGIFDAAEKLANEHNIEYKQLNNILKQRSEFAPNIKKYNCDAKFIFI